MSRDTTSKKTFQTEIGGKKLVLEFFYMAEQANAAVLAKYGETAVLVTVVASPRDTAANYLPLKVDYEERFYAAGKIIGSRYIRRESRPSEEAILSGRLVDRVIRPFFNQRLRREIQVVATVLAYDEKNEPDFVGLIGASAALGVSAIPWNGPAAGVRIAKIGDQYLINPDNSAPSDPNFVFEIFAAGPREKINMIELAAKEADEKEILKALALAQKEINHLAEFQEKIIKEIGQEKFVFEAPELDPELRAKIENFLAGRLETAVFQPSKIEQHHQLAVLKESLFEYLKKDIEGADLALADFLFEDILERLLYEKILNEEKRPDGRRLDEVRELKAEVGIFERTHGSALFQRGSTQALAVVTLAPPGQEQFIETMETTAKRRFMLHYNFPPYSVGEIGAFRGPGRREIGHGALADKALRPLLPDKDEFPYTIRVVSEILSSNGSSSMATVCAGSLALMDAGVPIKKPAAGIAMGLIADQKSKTKDQKYKILTDIQGPEDHHGDADFKVAGTADGVNACQMDVKIEGLTLEIIEEILVQARKARLEILDFMNQVLKQPRPELSSYAPVILTLAINPSRIGDVIGSGGRIINALIARTGVANIDIEEDGRIYVSADSKDKAEKAVEEIKAMTREYAVGEIVEGRVARILDFGAIIDLGAGRDGMAHVSELKEGFVRRVEDVLKLGDFVRAKVIRVDPDGKIGLSLKQLNNR